MLHDLEGEVDVVRNCFDTAIAAAKLGFYRNLRSGRVYAVSNHWDPDQTELLLTAVKGQRRALGPHELSKKYEQVELDEARAWWDAEYAKTPATEPNRFYLLSGALFPIYDKVMGSSGTQSVKIARARLVDGQSLVGLNLSPADVPQVKQRLGIGTPLGEASPAEILGLLSSGSLIELDNGWRLTTARITGDDVLELVLNGVPANRAELIGYGLSEEILHFKRRWFLPIQDAQAVVSRLIAQRKPVRDLTVNDIGSTGSP
jgi:hypothetical protein